MMERFQALFELSPIAQEEYDSRGEMVQMNSAALRLFGVQDPGELRHMNLFRNPHLPTGFGEKLQAGEMVQWDLEYDFSKVRFTSTRTGIVSLHATIFPIPGRGGSPAGYLLQAIDITEQTRSSRALREGAELHSTFIENLDAGWILIDGDMKVAEFHDTQTAILGKNQEQMIGKSLVEIGETLGFDEAELRAVFQSILRKGEPVRLQHQAIPGAGPQQPPRFVDITAFRVVLGDRPHVACFVTDVTSRQKLQDQLLQAQKMESIGRLAGSIAHDFNNLLSGILGNASMLELQPDDPEEVRTSASEIKEAAQRAADLTSSMLAFSRKKQPQREALSIAAAVRNVVALLERAKKPNIQIEIDVPDDLPRIEADQSQLESVIMNLFVNAVDAMPDGGRLAVEGSEVSIDRWSPGTNPAVGTGKWLRLTISDTGCGMDTLTSMRAFEPFYTTKSTGKGTGLGLYSVYGIVQNHGGQITLSSDPGQGTTFDLYFPVMKQRPRRTRKRSMGLPVQGHGTVLVVDDEKIIRQTLSNMLSRLGYRTLSASGGEEALEILKSSKEKVDLVLLDIVMQSMDGAETFRRIRKLRRPPHVLLMSGQAEQVNLEDLLQQGARGFLPKPFTLRSLSRKVRFALQG